MLEKNILVYHYPLITNIQSIRPFAPRILTTAMLPVIVLFADPLVTISKSSTHTTKTRDIRAVLFVAILGSGTENGPYEATDPFFDSVEAYFEARPTLALADGTTDLDHEYMNDDGETLTPYPTGSNTLGQFWTITFKHRFTIIKPVIYQSGE
jgi:hypothetical protein